MINELSLENYQLLLKYIFGFDKDDYVISSLVDNIELRDYISIVFNDLKERERDVLNLRLGWTDGHPRTLLEIAKEYNITEERVRQIKAKAFRKLRTRIYNKYFSFDLIN